MEFKNEKSTQGFLAALVQSASDAIISRDLNGIVISWNAGAERTFGYTAREMIGEPICRLLPVDRPHEESVLLDRIRSGERIEHYETKRVRRDGSIVDLAMTVSPVRDHDGDIIAMSTIARDIPERKKSEGENDGALAHERMARFEAQAANRLKDEFLAILSHELRTPLNAILGWASILGSRKSEDLIDRAVDVIRRNAEIQKRLIEDLLDVSRIQAGKLAVRSGRVDMSTVLNAAIESVRSAANAKGITVEVHSDTSMPEILADSDRLQQVVWNLLSNAIKFTPQGGKIDLYLRNTGTEVEIVVRDTGEGIPADLLPHVFERFRQGDSSITRQHGGIGIGLAVVRHLVEAHGGSVRASSDGQGQGATFVVKLPMLKECA